MRRVPREVWWLVGITVVMLVVAFVLSRGVHGGIEEQMNPSRSTYNNGRGGLRALYLTLGKLGYRAERWRRPFAGGRLPAGTLVMAEPEVMVAPSEWEALHTWVARGNTLVYCAEQSQPGGEPMGEMEDVLREAPRRYASPAQPTYLARGVQKLRVRTHTRLPQEGPEEAEKGPERSTRAGPFLPSWAVAQQWERTRSQAVPVFADEEGAVVSYARVGRGRLVTLCSPWTLSNDGIAHADNLPFALAAVGAPKAGPVFFDEYHQGFGENLAWALVPTPARLAVAQLLLAFGVLVYARSRRFGRVVPLQRESRERSEFLSTMTALLRQGEASRLAIRTAYEAAMHRLKRQLGLPGEAEVEEVGRAASRVNPTHGARLQAALERCREALQREGRGAEAAAVAMVREVEEAEREVGSGV